MVQLLCIIAPVGSLRLLYSAYSPETEKQIKAISFYYIGRRLLGAGIRSFHYYAKLWYNEGRYCKNKGESM
jgi:hypothetical protein